MTILPTNPDGVTVHLNHRIYFHARVQIPQDSSAIYRSGGEHRSLGGNFDARDSVFVATYGGERFLFVAWSWYPLPYLYRFIAGIYLCDKGNTWEIKYLEPVTKVKFGAKSQLVISLVCTWSFCKIFAFSHTDVIISWNRGSAYSVALVNRYVASRWIIAIYDPNISMSLSLMRLTTPIKKISS